MFAYQIFLASVNVYTDDDSIIGNDIAPLKELNTLLINPSNDVLNSSYLPIRGKCPYLNTNLDPDTNLCVCDYGYKADFIENEGCYKCPEKCGSNSVCGFPGICKCSYGYIGADCDIKIPIIHNFESQSCTTNKKCTFNVTLANSDKNSTIYCHYKLQNRKWNFIRSTKIEKHIYQCTSTILEDTNLSVSVSFNAKNISREIFNIEVKSNHRDYRTKLLVYSSILIIVTLVAIKLFSLIISRKYTEEIVPFSQGLRD